MLIKAIDKYPKLELWADKHVAILFDPGGFAEHVAELATTDLDDKEDAIERAEYFPPRVKAQRRAIAL
eukprot:11079555-Lingulodinium_polyedra.AAC.1